MPDRKDSSQKKQNKKNFSLKKIAFAESLFENSTV